MSRTTSQNQQKERIYLGMSQPPSETQHKKTLASQYENDSSGKETISNYTPDSLWSNLRYGLVMLAIIVIPPLIPGASVRLLIMGYMIIIVSIYTMAAIVAAMRVLRPTNVSKRGRGRKYYR